MTAASKSRRSPSADSRAADRRSPRHRSSALRAKRIYDEPDRGDGYRILIDRLWPRGVSRERALLDEWAPELAPSEELRQWFDHDPERFARFRLRYLAELAPLSKRLDQLRRRAAVGPLTILYGARDRDHNNAVVLVELLSDSSPARSTGMREATSGTAGGPRRTIPGPRRPARRRPAGKQSQAPDADR